MFSRVATLFLVFPLLASASVIVARGDEPEGAIGGPIGGTTISQCNTGELNCCNSVQSSTSHDVTHMASLVGVALDSLTAQVGLTCNPISVIGVGGNSCSAQPACCTGNKFGSGGLVGSLLVLGCNPINANL